MCEDRPRQATSPRLRGGPTGQWRPGHDRHHPHAITAAQAARARPCPALRAALTVAARTQPGPGEVDLHPYGVKAEDIAAILAEGNVHLTVPLVPLPEASAKLWITSS